MTVFPGSEPPLQRGPEAIRPLPRGLELFARIEGLVGEERALLATPAHERTDEQRDRLHVIGHELDHIWEALRERAERLGKHDDAADQQT